MFLPQLCFICIVALGLSPNFGKSHRTFLMPFPATLIHDLSRQIESMNKNQFKELALSRLGTNHYFVI